MSKSATSPQTLRVGVIGLNMGRFHVKQYQQDPRCEVVAICDLDETRLAAAVKDYGVTQTFTDPRKLIDSGEVDVVSIATPNTTHHPLTMAALKAGLHVLCEKPMAMNVRQAQQMVDAAAKSRRTLAIHYNHRSNAATQWLARAVQAGQLGEIYFGRAYWHRRRGIPARATFLDKSNSGGGCMIDLGVHMLDQILYVMGYPRVTSVTAATYTKFDKKDAPGLAMNVEDFAVAFVRFDSGATLEIEISWASHHHHAEQYMLQVYGSEGGARRLTEDYKDVAVEIYRREHGAVTTTKMDAPPLHIPSVQSDFIDAILNNREPLFSGRHHGLVGMKILDAIYQSAHTGKEVKLK